VISSSRPALYCASSPSQNNTIAAVSTIRGDSLNVPIGAHGNIANWQQTRNTAAHSQASYAVPGDSLNVPIGAHDNIASWPPMQQTALRKPFPNKSMR
jgi:hypothetical protein